MKHLKRIDELLKSTYRSASQGLSRYHGDRSKEIQSHAAEKGEDVKVDRIYPHKFIFNNGLPNEYFFITEIKYKNSHSDVSIDIEFKSNWGRDRMERIYLAVSRVGEPVPCFRIDIEPIFDNDDVSVSRKNANHLLKFFKQFWDDELSDEILKKFPNFSKKIKNLTVNQLYRSDN